MNDHIHAGVDAATDQPTPSPHSGPDGGHDMSGQTGHGDHVGMFRRLFAIMLVLAVPVILASDMFAMLVGYSLPNAAWIEWISRANCVSRSLATCTM